MNIRIGIATTYARAYYKFAKSLKTLKLSFDSILPQEIPQYGGDLVLTTRIEAPIESTQPVLLEEIFENNLTVIKGLMIQKLNLGLEQDLVIGVDPGKRVGISIFYFGFEIENSFYSSVDEVVIQIIRVLGGLWAKHKIVKIGDGNMEISTEIVSMLNLKFCSSFELEFVDERNTSIKTKNFNQRGKRDMLSAKYISQREGRRHSILPLSITG